MSPSTPHSPAERGGARRLQDGDPGGDVRRALEHLPDREMAARVEERYFRPDGRAAGQPYVPVPKLARTRAVAPWVQMATPAATLGADLDGVRALLGAHPAGGAPPRPWPG